MSGTFFTLNQKYNNLKTQTENNSGGGGGVPTSSTLADVLLNGNSAGSTAINMNGNGIQNTGNLSGVGTLTQTGLGQEILLGRVGPLATIAVGTGVATLPSGTDNICIGQGAGVGLLAGSEGNTILGTFAGTNVSSGGYNILAGWQSGQSITTQTENIILGTNSGNGPIGNNNVLVGSNTGFVAGPTINNSTGIGAGAVITESNQCVLGTRNTTVNIPGNIRMSSIYPTILTGATNDISTTLPLYSYYMLLTPVNMILTIPTPSASLVGDSFTLRRVGNSNNTTTVNSSASETVVRVVGLGDLLLGGMNASGTFVCLPGLAGRYFWYLV